MKTPRRSQNPLRTPLNTILGTEANVRLLRVLALAGNPVAAGELARRARLGRTTIYPALEALEKSGIVEFTGVGAQRQARFRERHPLGRSLVALFAAEAKRVDALVNTLRGMLKELQPRPIAAWLEGISTADDNPEETPSLWIVADPKSLATITSTLSEALDAVEQPSGVHLDVRGATRSELEARAKTHMSRLRDAVVLDGVPPLALVSSDQPRARGSLKSHQAHDARARRLAVAIAAKLKWDPTLTRIAREHVQERMKYASANERAELIEWSRLLKSMAPGELQQFLLEDTERATRLRQTLPALGLLTPVEREMVLASTSDDEARAAVLGR